MRNLIESIIRMDNATSKYDYRPKLQGVHLKGSSEASILVEATDGHILAQEHVEVGQSFESLDAIFPNEAIAKLKLFLKTAGKKADGFSMALEGTELTFYHGTKDDHIDVVTIKLLIHEYPDTSHLMMEDKTRPFKICINPQMLLSLYKAMNTEKSDRGITLMLNTNGSAIQSIKVVHGNCEGMLMPIWGGKVR